MSAAAASAPAPPVSGRPWKAVALASMADYIDAGSIIAGAAGLALWQTYFHLTTTAIGLLAAFSSNGISAGVGAFIGGRLGDRLGRKRIYAWDLVVYMFGLLWIIFAAQGWMLVLGYVLIGLAVGADVPTSWTMIAELAPTGSRRRMSGLAQVLWNAGPLVCSALAFSLSSLGVLGTRIVFVQLFVVAFVTWLLRRGMLESVRWKQSQQSTADTVVATPEKSAAGAPAAPKLCAGFRALFSRRYLASLLFCIGVYGIWALPAGTGGFFLPYILRTIGSQSQATSVLLQDFGLAVGLIATLVIFMPLSDRVNSRLLFALGALAQVAGMLLFGIFPLTVGIAIGNLALTNLGSGFGQRSFYQIWSAELFPTRLRATAQGATFAVARIALGLWSFFVPVLTHAGFKGFAWTLAAMYALSGLIGVIWTPRTQGRSLDELELDHADGRSSASTGGLVKPGA